MDEQHLVGDAVAIEPVLGHRLGGPNDPEHDIVVEVQRDTAGDRVALRGNVTRVRQPMAVEAVVGGLQLDPRAGLQLVRLRGRRHVVQERAPAREPFDAEQLLGVQAAVGSAVLRVALARDGASRDVVHGTSWPPRGEDASVAKGPYDLTGTWMGSVAPVGSNVTQPEPGKYTSTQAWASRSRMTATSPVTVPGR